MIQIKKLCHRGEFQIGLYFGSDESLKAKARSINARWSQTNKCWYVTYNKWLCNILPFFFTVVRYKPITLAEAIGIITSQTMQQAGVRDAIKFSLTKVILF